MTGLNKFDASPSMVGYLYQCRYALYAALVAIREHPGSDIAIERYDDVSFEKSGSPFELIQTKHHLGKATNLSDSTPDLWKTLRVWAERIAKDPATVFSTKFLLITTAVAADGSAASMLGTGDRDERDALRLLEATAATSSSQENEAGYKAFYDLTPETRLELLKAITVLDASPDINDMAGEIEQELFHAATADHRPLMIERLEGWWFARVVEALSRDVSTPISVAALDDKIDEIRESLQRNNLPVDFADAHPPAEIITDLDGRPFVRQLRKINVSAKRIEWAVRDYYRAFEQRARWAREELLVDAELDRYERSLVEAWEPRFETACEDIGPSSDEESKIAIGKSVFKWAETEADFAFRTVRERFLTHGSFHILANRLSVGWHPEFKKIGSTDE